jgi:hypothetical protein
MDFAYWLAAREGHDHAARHAPFAAALAGALPPAPRVLDLATGRGSNLRYLRRVLPADTAWTVLDADPALLALVDLPCARLQRDLRAPMHDLPAVDAVVGSALLDLVDGGFLDRLRDLVVSRRVPLLITLSVDGRLAWDRPDPDDARVHAWFRAHQDTDRGFGPSVGVRAVPELVARFSGTGFSVRTAEADWRIPADAGAFLAEMRRGIAEAAREMADAPAVVDAWVARRAALGGGLLVGHLDLLALPG